jgi:hypothetical protein
LREVSRRRSTSAVFHLNAAWAPNCTNYFVVYYCNTARAPLFINCDITIHLRLRRLDAFTLAIELHNVVQSLPSDGAGTIHSNTMSADHTAHDTPQSFTLLPLQ